VIKSNNPHLAGGEQLKKVGRNEPGHETAKRMVGTIGPGMTQELKQ